MRYKIGYKYQLFIPDYIYNLFQQDYPMHTNFFSFSIRSTSALTSSKSKCVYVFNVTEISACPMIYCNVLGFILAAAILEQNV